MPERGTPKEAEMARPTKYSEELAAELCSVIATSAKGLGAICKANENFPVPSTVYLWLITYKVFSEMYARAKADQAQILADQIISIADTPQIGVIITQKPDGVEYKRADMIEHRKLRIDSRKWVAAKLLPRKYGDKIEHSGPDGTPLPGTVVNVMNLKSLSDDELEQLGQLITKSAGNSSGATQTPQASV